MYSSMSAKQDQVDLSHDFLVIISIRSIIIMVQSLTLAQSMLFYDNNFNLLFLCICLFIYLNHVNESY